MMGRSFLKLSHKNSLSVLIFCNSIRLLLFSLVKNLVNWGYKFYFTNGKIDPNTRPRYVKLRLSIPRLWSQYEMLQTA